MIALLLCGRNILGRQKFFLSSHGFFNAPCSGRFKRSPKDEVCHILFEGVRVTPATIHWALQATRSFCQHSAITFMNGLDHWNFYDVGGHATLWFPAPEWAHQLIDRLSSVWTEYLWTTEVFLVIPWLFRRDWGRVTDIPCVLLHLPCYVHSLPLPGQKVGRCGLREWSGIRNKLILCGVSPDVCFLSSFSLWVVCS